MHNRKPIIIAVSFLTAIIIVEVILRFCLGIPTYGVEYKVAYRNGAAKWTNIRLPHTRLLNVEGSIVTKLNNYGLPGIDLESLDSLIVVLGSSYVEAFQYLPEDIASSLFMRQLNDSGSVANVMNLGCSGHDPYDSWFRLKYFETKLGFHTDEVVLVLNSDNRSWFSRHPSPFIFDAPKWFGERNDSPYIKLMIAARNSLSLIDLLAKSIVRDEQSTMLETANDKSPQSAKDTGMSVEMASCLMAFKSQYKNLMVVSTTGDSRFDNALQDFCLHNGISLTLCPLVDPEFLIDGSGHLNKLGNQTLAQTLVNVYTSQESNDSF